MTVILVRCRYLFLDEAADNACLDWRELNVHGHGLSHGSRVRPAWGSQHNRHLIGAVSAFTTTNDRSVYHQSSTKGHEATIVAARANWSALPLREPAMEHVQCTTTIRELWNKGKLVGQKAPFKLKEIWAIRVRLPLASRHRDLALFNLAVDSKPRACDLVASVNVQIRIPSAPSVSRTRGRCSVRPR